MDLTKLWGIGKEQVWSKDLQLALILLLMIFLFVFLAFLYQWYVYRKRKYKHFYYELSSRGFEQWEIKKVFNYLNKYHIDCKLFLESEKIARNVINTCGLDEEKTLQRLGFDTQNLIKQFLERQKELRKKWNR